MYFLNLGVNGLIKFISFLSSHSGAGAADLAAAVLKAVEQPVEFKFLYELKVSGHLI